MGYRTGQPCPNSRTLQPHLKIWRSSKAHPNFRSTCQWLKTIQRHRQMLSPTQCVSEILSSPLTLMSLWNFSSIDHDVAVTLCYCSIIKWNTIRDKAKWIMCVLYVVGATMIYSTHLEIKWSMQLGRINVVSEAFSSQKCAHACISRLFNHNGQYILYAYTN